MPVRKMHHPVSHTVPLFGRDELRRETAVLPYRLDKGSFNSALSHSGYQATAEDVYTYIRDDMLKKATVNMADVFKKREG